MGWDLFQVKQPESKLIFPLERLLTQPNSKNQKDIEEETVHYGLNDTREQG